MKKLLFCLLLFAGACEYTTIMAPEPVEEIAEYKTHPRWAPPCHDPPPARAKR